MIHPIYEAYLFDMKRVGASKPYMSEAQCLESAGIVIEEEHIPILQVRPKNQRPMNATHKNYEEMK